MKTKRISTILGLGLLLGLVSTGMMPASAYAEPVPAPWVSGDIGGPDLAGAASYDPDGGREFTVEGSGAEIWGASDEFQFVYQAVAGDTAITARVLSMVGPSSWGKAGVMIRETLDDNSKHAMQVMTPTAGQAAAFQWRPTTGEDSDMVFGGSMDLPYWVRVERSGNDLTGYISADGAEWESQGTQTIDMSENVYIGLVVGSNNPGELCTAQFDNVSAEGGPGGMDAAFTYQARLMDSNAPADGLYDLQFKLYDDHTEGTQLGDAVDLDDLDIIDGYLTAELGFGSSVFTGDALYIEIAVRPGESEDLGDLTTLSPRQKITPVPYAIHAMKGTGELTFPYETTVDAAPPGFSIINTFSIAKNGSGDGTAVKGDSTNGYGVQGTSVYNDGVYGKSGASNKSGVYGHNSGVGNGVTGGSAGGFGVKGWSDDNDGVYGVAYAGDKSGVYGHNEWGGIGVTGGSKHGIGVKGIANNSHGIYGVSYSADHAGVYGINEAGGCAAIFSGNVRVQSSTSGQTIIELGEGLDYAEGFDVSDKKDAAPGTVLIIDAENPGKLAVSAAPYDSKVAGIVAGAKGLGSAVRLGPDRFDHDVALAGRVYCNVDATKTAVEPGDLLTTSARPGYAMKAVDYMRAQGAILGKAMQKLEKGNKGQILVLVTLQ